MRHGSRRGTAAGVRSIALGEAMGVERGSGSGDPFSTAPPDDYRPCSSVTQSARCGAPCAGPLLSRLVPPARNLEGRES